MLRMFRQILKVSRIKFFVGALGGFVSGDNCNNSRTKKVFFNHLTEWCLDRLAESNVEVLLYGHHEEIAAVLIYHEKVAKPIMLINVGFVYCMYLQRGKHFAAASMENAIAHELCHLEQHRTGRLQTFTDGRVIWEGVEYTSLPLTQANTKAYLDQPWEREATLAGLQRIVELGGHPTLNAAWDAVYSAVK